MDIQVNIGSETNDALRRRLRAAIDAAHGRLDEAEHAVGGSQELVMQRIVLPDGEITMRTETYVGITLAGNSEVISSLLSLMGHEDRPEVRDILRSGTLAELEQLLATGFNVAGWRDEYAYDAVMTVVFARSPNGEVMIPFLRLLAAHGVSLKNQSQYGESALSVLSRQGNFDVIQVLLELGAPEAQLAWHPLSRAVVFGDAAQVREALAAHPDLLEAKDRWARTPFVLALVAGKADVADLLLAAGADTEPVDHVGRPPIFHAVTAGRIEIARWLLGRGAQPDAPSDGGGTALLEAVEADDLPMVAFLLDAGADPNHEQVGFSALGSVRSRAMAQLLLDAGADPAELRHEHQRLFLAATVDGGERTMESVSREEFKRDRTRRFGATNPERMDLPFWLAMIRSGQNGYQAGQHFRATTDERDRPIWSADRFGQSITVLPDGRVVQVAGEHEDGYDPDFCIYNDVFVHHPDGRIEIYGYPEAVFPPTDFHTATLVGNRLILIGSMGYAGDERSHAQVFALELDTWRMERLTPTGNDPGWISRHRAALRGDHEIVVTGGKVWVKAGEGEAAVSRENEGSFELDLEAMVWR